uniref:ribonuclease Z n=1 Tax=Amorphochlora amoebiformis TaxID=1561963 RepID=A0A7S0DNG8_9EUKA
MPKRKKYSKASSVQKSVYRHSKHGSMYLQFLGTSVDATPTVVLFTEGQRFVFNTGEGFQRMCTEHKVKLIRVSDILMTRLDPDTFGGLLGMLMTLGDIGMKSINLHGPANLRALLSASNSFARRDKLKKKVLSVDDPEWKIESDRGVQITAVPLQCRQIKTGTEPQAKRQRGDVKEFHSQHQCGDTKEFQSPKASEMSKASASVFSFVGKIPAFPGVFNRKRAEEIGIVPGRIYAKLKGGETVECTLRDGTTRKVKPSEVLTGGEPGYRFCILDCPSVRLLPMFIDSLTPYKDTHPQLTSDGKLKVVIHFSPLSVVNDERYSEFIQSFAPEADHIMVHPSMCGKQTVWWGSELNMLKLRLLDRDIFPQVAKTSDKGLPLKLSPSKMSHNLIQGRHLLKYILFPHKRIGLDQSAGLTAPGIRNISASFVEKGVDFKSVEERILAFRERLQQEVEQNKNKVQLQAEPKIVSQGSKKNVALGLLDAAGGIVTSLLPQINAMVPEGKSRRANIADILASSQPGNNPFITFLGTGSAVPTKYRSLSAIHIAMDSSQKGILLDCGEGAYLQIVRAFGTVENARAVLLKLECVWISHMHADHHLGLLNILHKRQEAAKIGGFDIGSKSPIRPLLIIGPNGLEKWLREFKKCTGIEMEYTFVCNYTLRHRKPEKITQTVAFKALRDRLGIEYLDTVKVDHCPDAWAAVIGHTSGWKIVYSGDCRPSAELIRVGRGAHVLIHEATFDDSLVDEAYDRKHSTVGEALHVGFQMRAERVILTHFSARYPKIPEEFEQEEGKGEMDRDMGDGHATKFKIPKFGVSFDLMRVRLDQVLWMDKLVEACRWIFPEHAEGEDDISKLERSDESPRASSGSKP